LKLEISFLDLVENMEIWFYAEDNYQKIGSVKYLSGVENISKKELFTLVKDDFGNIVKLKFNKKYFYKVYLQSKDVEGIRYISISSFKEIKFQGFSLLGF